MRRPAPLLAALLLPALAGAVLAQSGEPRSRTETRTATRTGPRTVAIVVYPGVELMDFAGPGEVFAAAGHGAFRVVTVAPAAGPLTSMGFLELTPQHTLADCPEPDVVVIPGGDARPDAALEDWLVRQRERGAILMSVCNGAGYLARAGLLAGLDVTTHRSAMASVQRTEPTCRVLTNRRFVDNGAIVTTAGISAGIDGALHLVARLLGDEAAAATAHYMEYAWDPAGLAELHARPAAAWASLATDLAASLRERGLEAAVAEHRRATQAPSSGPASEAELNRIGYELLAGGELEPAVELLRHVADRWPASANARDSLSEALEAASRTEDSLRHARAALALLADDASLSAARRERIRAAAEARVLRLETGTAASWVCPPCDMTCDEETHAAPGDCPACGARLVARTGS